MRQGFYCNALMHNFKMLHKLLFFFSFSGGVKRLLRRLPPLLLPNAQSLRPFRRVTPQEVKNGQIQTPQLLRIQTNGTNDYRRLWYWISDSPLSLINLLWPGLKTSAIKAPTLWRKTIMLRCQQRAFGYQFHFGDRKLWSMHMIVIHYKQIDWIIKSTYLIRLSCYGTAKRDYRSAYNMYSVIPS